MPLTRFDLNAIVLCHTIRFFSAARAAIERWNQSTDSLAASATTLLGNMLWASSSFDATSEEQQRAMAYSGALVSSLGDRVVQGSSGNIREQAMQGLAAVERQLIENHDDLIEIIHEKLRRRHLLSASPGRINEEVWGLLFPICPYSDQTQIVEVLVTRLLA